VLPLLLTIVVVCIGGLLVTLDETARMVQMGAGAGKAVPVAFIGALTTFGIASLLIAFLWRTTRVAQREAMPGKEDQKISGPAPAELTAPPASLGSVTEQTTRALDPPVGTH
jgi:hypothetical protein